MKASELISLIEEVYVTPYDEPVTVKQKDIVLHLKYDELKNRYLVDNIDLTEEMKKTKTWDKLKKILETMKDMNIGATIFFRKEPDGENDYTYTLFKLEGVYRMRVEEQVFNLDALLKNAQFKSYLERHVMGVL